MTLPVSSSAAPSASAIQVQRPGKPASPHVGSAMAVLATLEQARILPPEGTKEADRIIKSVIQLQSLFSKSTHPDLQNFMRRAVEASRGKQAPDLVAQFQASGWTSDVLEALAEMAARTPAEDLQPLTPGLKTVNLSVEDFRQFMQLVKDGKETLASNGQDFHAVFAAHRKAMPGAGAY
uniref:hypothetical protein n=1 Tax=Nitrospira cf. moscoviensis SBR1015 TaxID=96242 RepID=UPI00111D2745|nr:hypothetical protein [Nitrospira cf. moscoviensis SBR1015]